MDIEQYKNKKRNVKLKKNINKKEDNTKKIVLRLFNQILITAIIFLSSLIAIKTSDEAKKFIYKNVYNTNLKFTEASSIYQKYIGNIFPIGKIGQEESQVFQEKLTYQEANAYKDGVKLKVQTNYMVPIIESGIVVFIGEKEGYGNCVIIQQVNGIDVWYGNVKNKDIKMYDYVEKGNLLGETETDELYMVFQKEGKYLNYKDNI